MDRAALLARIQELRQNNIAHSKAPPDASKTVSGLATAVRRLGIPLQSIPPVANPLQFNIHHWIRPEGQRVESEHEAARYRAFFDALDILESALTAHGAGTITAHDATEAAVNRFYPPPPENWNGTVEGWPAAREMGYLVDRILLGPTPAWGNTLPVWSFDCKGVSGNTPSICPNCEPHRKPPVVSLPGIERRFRELGLIGEGQTIHWTGSQSRAEYVCNCGGAAGNSPVADEPLPNAGPTPREFDADSLPATYREGAKTDGAPLVVPYLAESIDWQLTPSTLAGARRDGKVQSVKVLIDGKLKDAHEFASLAAYRLTKTRREDGER